MFFRSSGTSCLLMAFLACLTWTRIVLISSRRTIRGLTSWLVRTLIYSYKTSTFTFRLINPVVNLVILVYISVITATVKCSWQIVSVLEIRVLLIIRWQLSGSYNISWCSNTWTIVKFRIWAYSSICFTWSSFRFCGILVFSLIYLIFQALE